MSTTEAERGRPQLQVSTTNEETKVLGESEQTQQPWWKMRRKRDTNPVKNTGDSDNDESNERTPEKWSMGMLNDKKTEEVPGTVLLLSAHRNEPLGMRHAPRNTSASSLPSPYPSTPPSRRESTQRAQTPDKKKTADGAIILDPQPDDSSNDPLNWSAWRRDSSLLSLGFYCMLGGGMTPILAAGYNNVSHAFNVTEQRVALTTGLYMMGLGVGSVIASPIAILFGKRPVYLSFAVIFILSAVWCAESPNFINLMIARIFQGIAVSPVECLPSATIAEIFFLHERAFRIGIYTLLLLGGKNLIPLVSAEIIQALGWRWVFWMVAIVGGFGLSLLFFFVPETFWDRTPHRHHRNPRPKMGARSFSNLFQSKTSLHEPKTPKEERVMTPRQLKLHREEHHVGFIDDAIQEQVDGPTDRLERPQMSLGDLPPTPPYHPWADRITPKGDVPATPMLHNLNSPFYLDVEKGGDYWSHHANTPSYPETKAELQQQPLSPVTESPSVPPPKSEVGTGGMSSPSEAKEPDLQPSQIKQETADMPKSMHYTHNLRHAPPKTYIQTLKPYNGLLTHTNWFKVAFRPFVLFTYPAILWSAIIYSLSIGWLIILSESVSSIYRSKDTYNFTALQVGLVYISPFIGGILGTAVAGRVSDVIVRYLSQRNGGVYEPEFRLVMALPVLIATSIGLMGFGWSAEEHDAWIVPTVFFGIISFGCALGSTTSITFAVDSYRQYAGEALVTLNFSKNIFHGLIWSLFFPQWLKADGSKMVFQVIGGLQIAACLTSIPMYIYGKRARMWTVRRGAMERYR